MKNEANNTVKIMNLQQFIQCTEAIRKLEPAAAADPGEERSHDHDETAAYRAYDQAYRELTRALYDDPDLWQPVFNWCQENI